MKPSPMKDLQDLVELREQLDTMRAQLQNDMGSMLKQLRRSRGLSLRAAAELLECDFSNLRRCEQGLVYSPSIIERAIKQYPKVPLSTTVLKEEPDDSEVDNLVAIK